MKFQRTRRAGSSLIETLVVIAVSSSLLVLAVGWIHQSFRLATTIRNHDRHHQSVMRLSRQFRDDAHFADSASCDDSSTRFVIHNDEIVVYRIQENVVRRLRQTKTGETTLSQDSFALHTHASVVFDDSELPGWVSLTVLRGNPARRDSAASLDSDNKGARPTDLSVRAAVGRLRGDRLASAVESEPAEAEQANPSEPEEGQP